MPRTPNSKAIPPATRVAVIVHLTERFVAGKLPRGSIKDAAGMFGVSVRFVSDLWQHRHDSAAIVTSRKQYPAREPKIPIAEAAELIAAVPLCLRQSLRSLAEASGIPKSTLGRYLTSGTLRRQISRVKPSLTPQHKKDILAFALSHILPPLGKNFVLEYVSVTCSKI